MLGIILIPLQSLELAGFEFNSVTFPVEKTVENVFESPSKHSATNLVNLVDFQGLLLPLFVVSNATVGTFLKP